jgi:thiol:disulfide interchange protein
MLNKSLFLRNLFVGAVIFGLCGVLFGEAVEVAQYDNEWSKAHLMPAQLDGKAGIAVVFEGTEHLHYYADKDTAPAGANLTLTAKAEGVTFGETVFPGSKSYFDSTQDKNLQVYQGNFTVFLPLEKFEPGKLDVVVTVDAIACTDKLCLAPFTVSVPGAVDATDVSGWETIILPVAEEAAGSASYAWPIWLALAVLVGLMFNAMPCVLPVIPLIIARLLNQSKESKTKSIELGFAFCGGILLFFAALSALSITVNLMTGTQLQWGDQFRNPGFIIFMTVLMMLLGLFMFDVFTFGIPASVTSKAGSGNGMSGSVGMGFLAALLSTPCSFGILAGVFAWAQTQTLLVSTTAMMLMGVGMAIPYAVLVSFPKLLSKVPKPGAWMELIRKAMGFVLLIIAVKLVGALEKDRLVHVLYYAIAISFAAWMWGGWVNFMSPKKKKLIVRGLAVLLAVGAGFALLPEDKDLVDWQKYDSAKIDKAVAAGEPVLIKFTADWCVSCAVVNKRVYKDEEVAELIKSKGIISFKGDTNDFEKPASIDLKTIYKEPGIPVTVIYPPGKEKIHLRGLIGKKDVMEILEELPDAEVK